LPPNGTAQDQEARSKRPSVKSGSLTVDSGSQLVPEQESGTEAVACRAVAAPPAR